MRIVSLIAATCAAALIACSGTAAVRMPDNEDCALPGDEDGNGLADCSDPACAAAPACQVAVGCGNGRIEAGEACDDGNKVNGDGCDNNCTATACGNGVASAGEGCDDGNKIDGDGCDSNCTVTTCGNGILTAGESCDDGNTTNWDGCDATCTKSVLAYVKASNTDAGDALGGAIAMSADGSTLAVAADLESSAATGIDGNQADNAAADAGAVYIYVRTGATWIQQAYVKASNTGAGDRFGTSVALSADGSTLAVGALGEDGAAAGIDGDPADNTAPNAGAVYVFARAGTLWKQQAYVKASNPGAADEFGFSVALSADGATLAVGAVGESSAATGVDGDQADDSAENAGAAYVFTRDGASWSQEAYVKASNPDKSDAFGVRVALSADGATLAVGAVGESSAATGIGGDQSNNAASGAGAVYVFARGAAKWSQQAYLKASTTAENDRLGSALALSRDGSTLAAGASGAGSFAGAAYVFVRTGTTWSQQALVKASNASARDSFGASLALSTDGATLAVGAPFEASAATGLNGNQLDDTAGFAGAVYLFTRNAQAWTQPAYVKATNTGAADLFGTSLALSGDGVSLAVGAPGEDSAATGIDGNQNDDSGEDGAVYVFR